MMEFAVVLVMFSPAIAGIAIIVGCVLGEISHKKKMKKQDEQLDFLHEKMGDNKYFVIYYNNHIRHKGAGGVEGTVLEITAEDEK